MVLVDAPPPALRPGWVLVSNRCSLISAGTERSKVELGGKSLLQKGRARPDLVRKVVDRARVEGVRSAVAAARERLDALTPIGYSSAGHIVRVGREVHGLAPGDPVACGGGGWASHAQLVAVPRNLVAKVGDGVALESAAYATVGAIALHAVRTAQASIGERVGVIGLGLVGQLAIRLLSAGGCHPVGVDVDAAAVELAAAAGARAFERDAAGLEAAVLEETGGIGLDAVLVCAAADSRDPLDLAVALARERGRVVVVGDVPIQADRAALYDKELRLVVSRSYGPGRYDREYEERGRDLPPSYVRWTEGRNMQAFVDLVATGALEPRDLTTHRFPVERASDAYAALTAGNGDRRPFGIVLEYPESDVAREGDDDPPRPASQVVARAGGEARSYRRSGDVRLGLVGAGAFARATLIPALAAAGVKLAAVSSAGGLSAADVAQRFGFDRAAHSPQEILDDPAIDAVVIATRHGEHAELAAAALERRKAVFVEKPLALDSEAVKAVEAALFPGCVLMVGFNRRFAPLVGRLIEAVDQVSGRVVTVRVNAGPLPADHWLHDPVEGGGRLLGEACHFVDLLAHVAGADPTSVSAFAVPQHERSLEGSDQLVGILRFANGSVGSLVYAGAGDPRLPKERVELFGGGVSAVLDDFRRLEIYSAARRTVQRGKQDKGHRPQLVRFVRSVMGELEPPPVESYLASSRATIALAESLRSARPVDLA